MCSIMKASLVLDLTPDAAARQPALSALHVQAWVDYVARSASRSVDAKFR